METVCLLPGWGFNKAVWAPLCAALPSSLPTSPLDLPCFPNNTATLDDYAEAIGEQINGPLLGWSFGGLLALGIARRLRDKISQLILITSTPCFSRRADWPHGMPTNSQRLMQRLLAKNTKTAWQYFCRLLATNDTTTLLALQKLPPPTDLSALKNSLDLLFALDLRAELAALDCPVLICLGAHDPLVDLRIQTALQSLNTSAVIKILPYSGHVPHISHPAQLATEITTFIYADGHG